MTRRGVANVVSVSGGKDSTATALYAIDQGAENLTFVFADTGHEHPQTYEYLDYLDGVLRQRAGVGITTVRADFSDRIAHKREIVETKWREEGVPEAMVQQALSVLQPTGIPMLDLCLWKGRPPSPLARFCTSELKVIPIEEMQSELLKKHRAVVSWQGVRADESRARRDLPEREAEFGQWEPEPAGLLIYRPILHWTAAEVFDYHRKHQVLWNPLYEQGMGRVGCMPCIHARKDEIRQIAKRFPEQFERLAEWESLIAKASKRGLATWFCANTTPGTEDTRSDARSIQQWALTSRGGRQYDLIHAAEAEDEPGCSSVYGLCE